jgi:hypothetical protein
MVPSCSRPSARPATPATRAVPISRARTSSA